MQITSISITKFNLLAINHIYRKKQKIKTCSVTSAITSISRVSRLTGAIMRSLGIITESIDVTIMPVGRTLVNIYRWKESSQREKV